MKLHFDHALVARLLAHAQAASEHSPTYDQLVDPAFSDAEGQANLVAYAVEADPRTCPDDWYDVKRASFGGDDGAEFLSADTIRKALEATAGNRLWIDVTPARISCPYLASPQKARSGQPDGGSGKAKSE